MKMPPARIAKLYQALLKHCPTCLASAMIDFLQQRLLTLQRHLQPALATIPLDGHTQDIGGSLQKGDVLFDKLAIGFGIDLQHTERFSITLQDNIHSAVNAVLSQKFRCSESILVFQMRTMRFRRYHYSGFDIGLHFTARNARIDVDQRTHNQCREVRVLAKAFDVASDASRTAWPSLPACSVYRQTLLATPL